MQLGGLNVGGGAGGGPLDFLRNNQQVFIYEVLLFDFSVTLLISLGKI
jgi:hypothetical protein